MTSQQSNPPVTQVHFPAAATADICDANPDARILSSRLHNFGGQDHCAGPIEIISTQDDNSLVKTVLKEPGAGRVLLIDNRASCACAMLGGNLADQAIENDWAGIVVNGAIRDSLELKSTPLAIFALATSPRRSINRGTGRRGQSVRVGNECVTPNDFLVADIDGVVLLTRPTISGEIQ